MKIRTNIFLLDKIFIIYQNYGKKKIIIVFGGK